MIHLGWYQSRHLPVFIAKILTALGKMSPVISNFLVPCWLPSPTGTLSVSCPGDEALKVQVLAAWGRGAVHYSD